MSQPHNHLPGDVAPLPSPTAHGGPIDDYLPSLEQQSKSMAPQSHHPHFQAAPQSQQHPQSQTISHYSHQHYSSMQSAFESQPQQNRPSSFVSQPSANPQHQVQPSGPVPPSSGPHAGHQPQQQGQMGSGAAGDASIHLRDFNLIAEAAKRAQVAVVTRDMEDVSL